MAVDYTFTVKKIKNLDGFFAAFSPFTKMPLLVCDEETADDQIYIFGEEDEMKKFIATQTQKQVGVAPVKIPKEQMGGFFTSLYAMAVNRVVYTDGTGECPVELSALAPVPDFEKLKESPVPVMNPVLNLTIAYFVQELRRPGMKDNQEIREMEEEMIVNMIKSKFILAIEQLPKAEGAEGENQQNVRIPLMKTEAGDVYQPVYTDIAEFRKHVGVNAPKFKVISIPFPQLLPHLVKEAKGYVVNPTSFSLILNRERLEQLKPQQ